MRICCGPARGFMMHVVDNAGQVYPNRMKFLCNGNMFKKISSLRDVQFDKCVQYNKRYDLDRQCL